MGVGSQRTNFSPWPGSVACEGLHAFDQRRPQELALPRIAIVPLAGRRDGPAGPLCA